MKNFSLLLLISLLLTACMVGPDYSRPPVAIPNKFKETPKNWKIAQPQDAMNHDGWWKLFHDQKLNAFEMQLNQSNQTVAVAAAQYLQARALVDEARAAYFPTLTATVSATRQRQVSGSTSFISASSTGITSVGSATSGVGNGSPSTVNTTHSWFLNAVWGPDLWGSVGRSVEASRAGVQASAAALASTRLLSQAMLAQTYFQLRTLDREQQLLDQTVHEYKRAIQLTKNRYHAGVAPYADVVQAEAQYDTALSLAINNHVNRAQFEHAIAVLIGVPPSDFSIMPNPASQTVPTLPAAVPSTLLERRPDIAESERLVAQANAEIGIAVAAYFPALTLTANASEAHPSLAHWFSVPNIAWSLGPQLAETIFDGGLRNAIVKAARANYQATVATYRQTVLTAFQDVEDNLASLRILKQQSFAANKAAMDSQVAMSLVMNQYKAGLVDYSSVITAQTAAYTAEQSAVNVTGLRMISAVGLVKALGGGWDAQQLHSDILKS